MVDHAQPSENLDLPMIINPFILGFMLSFALFGVFVAQCFFYYHSFRKDPLWTKIYVGGIMLLETAAIVLSVIAAWHIVGVMTFDRHSASLVAWATLLTLPLSGTLTSLVHGFYAWRIYRLTDTRLVPCIVGMISLAQLGMTIELIVQLEGPSFNLLHVKPNFAIVVVWLSGAAGADILITIRMVVFLMKTRRACNFDYTESLMQQLIRVFVETGLTTTFAVITALILYVARHETNLYLIPIYMLTGLYCNSLMATLNSRAVLGVGRINYPQNRLSRILPMTGGHGTTVLSHSDACSEVTDSLADATSRRRRTSSTSNTRSFSPGLIFWQDRPNFNIVTPGGQKTGGRNALPSMHMLSKLNRPLTRPGGTGKRLPGNIFISRSTVARSEGPARDALVEDCNESVDEIKVPDATFMPRLAKK